MITARRARNSFIRRLLGLSIVCGLLVIGQFVTPLATSAAPVQRSQADAPNFTSASVSNDLNNTCLDVYHGGTANYTNVDVYTCNQSGSQTWQFNFLGNTQYGAAYQIKNPQSGKCLDVDHSGTAAYTNVDIFTCNNSAAQTWVQSGDAFRSGVTASAGLCLDVYHGGTADYTNVDIYPCNGSGSQIWYIGTLV